MKEPILNIDNTNNKYLYVEDNIIYEISLKKHDDNCKRFLTVKPEEKETIEYDKSNTSLIDIEVINVSVYDKNNEELYVKHFYLDSLISDGDKIDKDKETIIPNKKHFTIDGITSLDSCTYTSYVNDYYTYRTLNYLLGDIDINKVYDILPIYFKNKDKDGNIYKIDNSTYPTDISIGLYLDDDNNVKITNELKETLIKFIKQKYIKLINNDLHKIDPDSNCNDISIL